MTHGRDDAMRALFAGPEAGAAGDHLDDETLAALLEARSLDDADPAVAEHLAACDSCRRTWARLRVEAVALADDGVLADVPWELERKAAGREPGRDAGSGRSIRAWPWRLLAGAGAALVLAGVALLTVPRITDPRGPDVLRSEPGPASLDPLAPAGPVAAVPPPEFRWIAVPDATAYEVVVADAETGETILRLRATSPSRRLTEDERSRLEPGRTYRWLVRAERGVGRTSTGAAADFHISAD